MPVIQVQDIHKRYRDGTHAVRGVSFEVKKGEIFGLLGPNGAGKTTTMHILGTLHHATSGRAKVLGLDVHKDAAALRKRIGFAMQEVGMDDLATAQEMLMFHAGLYGMTKQEAIHRAKELLEHFDLMKHRKRRVMAFSGGMQRRLDLAVSLIHQPEVLYLDEPSTGLDPTSRQELWDILRRLRREEGLTILMSTHYMEEADALCDRIAVIDGGKVAAIGTPTELKRQIERDTITLQTPEVIGLKQAQYVEHLFGGAARVQGQQIQVRVKDGGSQLMPVLMRLHEAGIQVTDTKVHTPTLDDVFLKFTGSRLEDEE